MATKKSSKKKSRKKTTKSNRRASKNKAAKKTVGAVRNPAQSKNRRAGRAVSRRPSVLASEQSGDSQGLSRRQRADSEIVDELVGEGNAFEAGVVAGVEEAEEFDEREVHAREVLDDDVPGEYLDKDS